MEKFYSKVDPSILLHFVIRKDDFVEGRQDLISAENFIQCSTLNLKAGVTFRPHKHIWKERDLLMLAQESWVVLTGKVRCTFYDLNDKILAEPILKAGDASFTLQGGHNYLILADNSKILEFKSGPYFGQKMDKTFIE